MEKAECNICGERHHERMDCVSILRGHLHVARKRYDEMSKEKADLELVYSALKHGSVAV
mgnify:CR=1 FL=1